MLYAMEDYAVYAVVSSFHLRDLAANEVSFAVTVRRDEVGVSMRCRMDHEHKARRTSFFEEI
jgi:hypothetical protein